MARRRTAASSICASPLSSSAEEDTDDGGNNGGDVFDDWRHLDDEPTTAGGKRRQTAQHRDDSKSSKRKRSDSGAVASKRRAAAKPKAAKTKDVARRTGPISKKELVASASERFVQYLADQLDPSNQATLCEEFGFGQGCMLRLPKSWPELKERRAFAAWATSLGFAASAVHKQLYRISSLNLEILLPELRKRVRVRRERYIPSFAASAFVLFPLTHDSVHSDVSSTDPNGGTGDDDHVNGEADDHSSESAALPDAEAASLQSFKEHFQRLDEEELEMLSVSEHDRLLSTIRHEQIAEAMEEVLARPSVRKDRDRARRMSRLGRISGRRLSVIPLRQSIAVTAADQFGWAAPIVEEEEEEVEEEEDRGDADDNNHASDIPVTPREKLVPDSKDLGVVVDDRVSYEDMEVVSEEALVTPAKEKRRTSLLEIRDVGQDDVEMVEATPVKTPTRLTTSTGRRTNADGNELCNASSKVTRQT
ncbi:hypothetical protein PINS_up000026 [Pythium insidiosum]|nr:hypothetical protein PINS_up000026 [Pythium insidiosum]